MESKPKARRDHTVFYFISLMLIIASQLFEMVMFPIGGLLRAVVLALAILSATWGVARYWNDQGS